jgi:uncharacterized protein (TIGR03435 family)
MLPAVLSASLVVFTSCAAFGQSAAPPSFAAVSIKPVKPDFAALKGAPQPVISVSPGSVTMRNITLKDVIMAAYGVKDYQISGPASLNSGWYDILAKADGAVSPDQLKLMLQALLADRFKLALHHDTKELAMYALVGGRKEPKLHAGKPDGESSVDIAGGAMVFRNYSMSKLADYLSARAADHPVTDTTGLSGPFDFTVQLADGPSANPVNVKLALGQAMRDGTLAKLVAEQLGLKLESRKGPVPILVIDHAEKASEN